MCDALRASSFASSSRASKCDAALLVRSVAWALFVFEVCGWFSRLERYTIDVIGGIFVAYSFHLITLDMESRLNAHRIAEGSVR
jgi:hypothetical protein